MLVCCCCEGSASHIRLQALAGGGPERYLFVFHRTHGRVMPVIALAMFPA